MDSGQGDTFVFFFLKKEKRSDICETVERSRQQKKKKKKEKIYNCKNEVSYSQRANISRVAREVAKEGQAKKMVFLRRRYFFFWM